LGKPIKVGSNKLLLHELLATVEKVNGKSIISIPKEGHEEVSIIEE